MAIFTADHSAAYGDLPLNPPQEDAFVVTLRRPSDGEWRGFFPLTLLFWATAAVLHYDGFSRIVAILADILFGLPAVNYFDDFGRLLHSSLFEGGVSTFMQFFGLIGVTIKEEKT